MGGVSSAPASVVGIGTVLLLAATQFAAFVDRAAPSVVAAPLKAEFALRDAQVGALQGPAFAITYVIVMLAAGHWVRRTDPFRLMALCVAVWTLGGLTFAMAQSYPMLLAGRMLLGVGQAAFAPAALMVLGSPGTTIGRARAISMFTTGSSIGRSGSLFLGGLLLMMVAGQTVLGLEPWRSVSVLLVLPNIVLIAGLLVVSRRNPWTPGTITGSGLNDAIGWLLGAGRSALGLFLAGSGCVLLVQSTGAWMPTILYREFGLTVSEAALATGLVVIVAAPVGHLSAGWILGRPRSAGPATVMTVGLLLAAASVGALTFADTGVSAMAALIGLVAGGGVAAATALISVQPLAPDRIRGGVNALFLASSSLIGVGLGPWLTGWFSDLNEGHASGLSLALAQIVIGIAVLVIPVAIISAKHWSLKGFASRPTD